MKPIIHFYTLGFKINILERKITLKKKDPYKPILGILLLMYIGTMIVLQSMKTDMIFSESENRRLEQAPKISKTQVVDGRFTTNYEKYISDQFPLRDFWIGVKSKSEKIWGKKENNGVYIGKDGYLLEKFQNPSEEDFESKVAEINDIAINLPNVNKYFMLVPNSTKVLEDKLPPYAPNGDELDCIDQVKSNLDRDVQFVDVYQVLQSNRDKYIYYKTDHHWTTRGAFLAYIELMGEMEIEPRDEKYYEIKKFSDSFYGSLYSKSGIRDVEPDTIELYIPKDMEEIKVEYLGEGGISYSLYDMDSFNKKDKYTVFLGGNHPLIKIESSANTTDKLLILKDSYANSFIPFLTSHFSEIYVVDPRYYDEDLVDLMKDEGIDNLLILYNVKTFFE
ncbi:hypothetical protein C3E88_09675 [Clostridium sp. Cult3]|nr:hypothetical protein [Clostridium sp. Cult3]